MALLPHTDGGFVVNNIPRCQNNVLRVVVTEGTTEIALALVYRIFIDEIFGPNQLIFISLYESRNKATFLESVAIQLTGFSPNLLAGINQTHDPAVAFQDADVVFSIGQARSYEFTPDEYMDPFFKECTLIAKLHGDAIERYAKRDVKVIVLGNTAATIISRCAKSIDASNITALSLYNLKLATAHIADRVGCLPDDIKNVIIWGTNNEHSFPDCRYMSAAGGGVTDKDLAVWLRNDLPHIIQTAANKCWCTRSLAYALADHCKLLWHGTPKSEWTCMSVLSDNSYRVRSGIFFSYPIICADRKYKIVQDLSCDDFVVRHVRKLSSIVAAEVNAALKTCNLK